MKLKYFFYLNHETKDDVYLNLILEYVPDTVYRMARQYVKNRQPIPTIYIKLYTYQASVLNVKRFSALVTYF